MKSVHRRCVQLTSRVFFLFLRLWLRSVRKGILLIRMDGIGDAVLTVPILRAIREKWPEEKITLVCRPAQRELLACCPYLDEIVDWAPKLPALRVFSDTIWKVFLSQWTRFRTARYFHNTVLKKERYRTVLLLRADRDDYGTLYLAAHCGGNIVGFGETFSHGKSLANAGWDLCCQTRIVPGRGIHEVERGRDLVQNVMKHTFSPQLELWCSAEEASEVEKWCFDHFPTSGKRIILGVGAGSLSRIWPTESFSQLVVMLTQDGWTCLPIGGKEDISKGEAICRQAGIPFYTDFFGHWNLRKIGHLMKLCDGFVGNDSGPMHMAAAAGLPVVMISKWRPEHGYDHPSSPERFGPVGVPSACISPSSDEGGMSSIPAKQVRQALVDLIGSPAGLVPPQS